jgi:NAD+ diphosphatase
MNGRFEVDGTLVFAGGMLLRLDRELTDPAWLAASHADPRGRYLVLRNFETPVTSIAADETTRLVWATREQLPTLTEEPLVLGLEDGVPHFAVDVAEGDVAEGEVSAEGTSGVTYADARMVASMLPVHEAAVVGHARSLATWHARTRFCSKCGAATASVEGGARRQCTVCETRYYPSVDPSIIVLVEHEGRALLAGRVGGPGGRKSCVAGFVEPGESIEEAVVREVFEETGVHVGDVEYSYSQPWPFPGVLMIGCRAVARTTEINVDGVEIGHADWYTREQVRAALDGASEELAVPSPLAIAHHLMRDWSAAGG